MYLKAIVFDLDGTIADTIPLTVRSLHQVILRYSGKDLSDEEIIKEFGPIDTQIARKFIEDGNGEEAEEEYIRLYSELFDHYVKPIAGMQELLQAIKAKGIQVGLFTGRSLRSTEITLEKLSIRHCFDVIIPGDDTKKPKPDPEGILLALDKLGVKTCEAAYVGDFAADILASKAAGTVSVLALWSSTGNKELLELNPDQYFTATSAFWDWLIKEK